MYAVIAVLSRITMDSNNHDYHDNSYYMYFYAVQHSQVIEPTDNAENISAAKTVGTF